MREEMTREEAIGRFREMWLWIAEESKKKCRKIHKKEYFEHIGVKRTSVRSECYLCEYAFYAFLKKTESLRCCDLCPINFQVDEAKSDITGCRGNYSLYRFWDECNNTDWKHASMYAKMISELPERPLG